MAAATRRGAHFTGKRDTHATATTNIVNLFFPQPLPMVEILKDINKAVQRLLPLSVVYQ